MKLVQISFEMFVNLWLIISNIYVSEKYSSINWHHYCILAFITKSICYEGFLHTTIHLSFEYFLQQR